jgi:membrane fusion protein (multidrug efflux system)
MHAAGNARARWLQFSTFKVGAGRTPLKKLHLTVAVVGMALIGTAAWWWQQQPRGTAGQEAARPASAPAGAAPGAQGGPAAVEVAVAQGATLVDEIQAVGTLGSNQGVMLRPETSGRVARLGFANGQQVKRGQLLVQLDDTLQQAQLQQAQAQAGIARTNLQRSRELQAQGFVSHSAVDQNLANMQVAQAQVAVAQAQLARMQVLAPFDGTVGLRAVDVGDYVKDGADLVNIEDLSSLMVRFALPERVLERLRVGQPVEVSIDALPGRAFKGRVQAVDSQLDANGRALQVLAQLANPGGQLRPGMFARARVVFAVLEGAVVVPEEALVPLGGKQLLFKVQLQGEGKAVAQRLEARVGLRLPGKVQVLAGVQPGDQVVTAGHARLLRGDSVPVRVVDLARAGAAAAAASAAGKGGKPAGPAASMPK